ncbi:MAG: helix-turn-helix domain-containing protein, partial [Muribaculaceae bacterium]|nr:helix-turn-helix domain-containing protein [Muribaculaceae bacterium]
TVTALDTTSILLISKQEYLRIMTSDSVFLFNYLNLLSMTAQKSLEGILAVSTGDLPERIAFWISALTQPRSYDIHLECKQRDLVALFGVPRTSLRAALEEMKEKGLVDFSPYGIDVKNRRELLNLLHNHSEQPD